MEAALRRTFASLEVRNFRLYMLGQVFSLAGNWMQVIALSWLVLLLTHSGTQLGLVMAAQFLPILVFGAWGGVIADSFNKRHILYVTQALLGLLALTLGWLVVSHHIQIWMVYALSAVMGLIMAVDTPTRQTFIMEIVGPANVKNAVSLHATVQNMARVAGPALAGALIALVGTGDCFLLNGLSFGAVLIALKYLRRDELLTSPPANRQPGQIREGLRYVLGEPRLRSTLLMMFIIGTFAYEFPVIFPLFATVSLHGHATTYSTMTACMGMGAIFGGLYTAGRHIAKERELIMAALMFGLSLLALAAMPTSLAAYAVLFFVGILSLLFISLGNSTLQLTSRDDMRGRVMSLWSIAFLGTTPIGGPIIGAIADHTNPRIGLATGGLAALLAAALGAWAGRTGQVPSD